MSLQSDLRNACVNYFNARAELDKIIAEQNTLDTAIVAVPTYVGLPAVVSQIVADYINKCSRQGLNEIMSRVDELVSSLLAVGTPVPPVGGGGGGPVLSGSDGATKVGYTRVEAGAQATTVAGELAKIVSVSDFGTLQQALAAANGKPLNLDDGSFGGLAYAAGIPAGKIRIIAGTLRQNKTTRTQWDYIQDATHTTTGLQGTFATAVGGSINVPLDQNYKRVISLVCGPDEYFANAHNMTVGASVGNNTLRIQAGATLHGAANIQWLAGSTNNWSVTAGNGQDLNFKVKPYDRGLLDISHDYCPSIGLSVTPVFSSAVVYLPVLYRIYHDRFTMAFVSATTGLMINSPAPDPNMNFYVQKSYSEGLTLDGTGLSSTLDLSLGNIWFIGIMEAA